MISRQAADDAKSHESELKGKLRKSEEENIALRCEIS